MSARSTDAPSVLDQVQQIDRFRLLKKWQRLERGIDDEAERQRWHQQVAASAQQVEQRRGSVPDLHYDSELPISAHREAIIELLRQRQVIVVCGETGSGKSTQLPKLCLEAGLGARGVIGHTQPRRLAARAVANRLAEELRTQVGELVGYKIRFTDATGSKTLVKLMTDGVLLAETQSDRFLDRYEAIIIDEAHERSLNIDFLLGYLRKISGRRPDLRIIITSATIDPERFAQHFVDDQGPAPIVEVSGRTYPVEIRYRDWLSETGELDDEHSLRGLAAAVDELMAEGSGDILTFLPTERDIRVTAKYLRGHLQHHGREPVDILPLYARLSQAEQNKIFASHQRRRVVLSTNVAESSLTVPGIHYVIDTGLVRISRYAPRSRVQRLPIESISQASANQRSGRCGRLGPGTCIRLFAEDDFESRPKFTTPEIRRSDLASVLLQSLVLKLGPLEEFPLLDPPGAESVRDGQRTLSELGAIDDRGRLTKVGQQLGALPTDPRVGRMLIEASERQCLADVLIIAAALECQDVRQRPAGQQAQADEAHQPFRDPHSDFFSYLRLFAFYEKLRRDLGRSRLQKALHQNFLSHIGFREWSNTIRQLRELAAAAGLSANKRRIKLPKLEPETDASDSNASEETNQRRTKHGPQRRRKRPEGYAAIHQSLLSGLLSGVAMCGDGHEYQATRGLKIALWPGSGLFRRQPKWIVVAEIVETSRRYGRTIAEVDVEWIERAAQSLLKHSYYDPHWSSKTGSPMVYRRSSLFGLSIVAGRRVPLTPIDPEAARTLMIEQGLVAGDWKCVEKFYLHNQELLADMHELAQRTRSRDYILDRFHLGNFYNARVPLDVTDLASLRAWLKRHGSSEEARALWMQPNDLLKDDQGLETIDQRFPNAVQIGKTSLPLEYHFEPGHSADGVTATVPQAALRQVSEESLGWLVPGLLEEKILHLIRGLPKHQRTNYVPAPDVARRLAAELSTAARDEPFMTALCRAMQAHSGESIRPSEFNIEKLPAHLRFYVKVVDDQGVVLEEGRDITHLQQAHALAPTHSNTETIGSVEHWDNRVVTVQEFECSFEPVSVDRGGVKVAAFPALVDLEDRVELQLVDTEREQQRSTTAGLTRLLSFKHRKSLKSHVAHLPQLDQCLLRLGHVLEARQWRAQLSDLIARAALVENQPLLIDRAEWEARNARASTQISIQAQEVASWLPKLAEAAHELRLKMEKAPASWHEVAADVEQQLAHLCPTGFLQTVPWRRLAEYPRYLSACSYRLNKLSSGGLPKDRRLREPVERAWHAYQTLAAEPAQEVRPQLVQLRWLIEEFRVSIFAQPLGTKEKVSEKRLDELIKVLES